MVSSECLLLGAKKVEGGGWKIGTVGRMRERTVHLIVAVASLVLRLVCTLVLSAGSLDSPSCVIHHFNNTQNI
jgi:hypothetical protein